MKEYVKVLIVEDELIAAENLREFLQEHHYEVLAVTDRGEQAIELTRTLQPDVVFMDIMLKGALSGSEAALMISQFSNVKIIFLTAYAQDEMLDYAEDAKASAYLVKPYNKAQILATLRSVLQYEEPITVSQDIPLCHHYVFNPVEQQLYYDSAPVKLGPRAKKLLALLCKYPGEKVSNEQLYMHIWGEKVDDGVLRALVYRTRAMLHEELIENVSGSGYRVISASSLQGREA